MPCGKSGCGSVSEDGEKAAQVSATRICARFQKKTVCAHKCNKSEGKDERRYTVLTSAALEPVFVPEGRKRIRHHLRELQRRAIVIVSALERLDESLKRSGEILE